MSLPFTIALLLAAPAAGALIGSLWQGPIGGLVGALIGAAASVPGTIRHHHEMVELRELARPRTFSEQQRIDIQADRRRARREIAQGPPRPY